LSGRLQKWLKETGAQMPVPNPDHDGAKAGLTAAQAKAKGLI
jgi:hypothetical protein